MAHTTNKTASSGTDDGRFRLVVEATPNGILMSDADGCIVLSNHAAENLFGYSREEFLDLSIDALVPQRYLHGHPQHRHDFMRQPSARAMGHGRDLFAVRKDGTEFAVEIGLTPVPTEDSGTLVLCVVVDITERKKAETALHDYAAELERRNIELHQNAAILNNVHDAVFLVREDGVICSWNAGAAHVYGFSADEAIGSNVRIVLPPKDPNRFVDRVLPSVRRDGVYEFTDHSRHSSGNAISVAVRASLLPPSTKAQGDTEQAADHVIICANEITEQERLQNEILEVSEGEQRRIGQDIHDDLCQQLAAISCIAQVFEQQAQDIAPDVANGLANIGELIAQANHRAGEIARNLVPAILESDGLAVALEELAQRTRNIFGVKCGIECDDLQLDAPPKTSVQLYRIAQEAISNAVRHSDADAITLSLAANDQRLVLTIADDGQGIAETLERRGLGLLTMARRAETIGADLNINSEPGKGTRITCSLPFTPAASASSSPATPA